jgi:alcohol dehydrogenase class IV
MIEKFPDQEVCWPAFDGAEYLSKIISEFGARKVFLVTGKRSFQACGAQCFIESAVTGVEVRFYNDFRANPQMFDLFIGLKEIGEFGPDLIVAIGGGSVLDIAKLLNYFHVTGLDPLTYLKGERSDVHDLLPLVAIPTTAGTGSEATHFSVLYNEEVKYSVAEQCMIPKHVILQPEFTYALSPYQTACTGMDTLTQGIESLWALGKTDESRQYARRAVSLALDNLEIAVGAPNPENRRCMLEAAYWSGRAINISKTTLSHALSYALTSFYGYPHGHAVAVFLPTIFELHEKRGALKEDFYDFFDEGLTSQRLLDLCDALNLHGTHDKLDMDPELVAETVNLERMANNPVQLNKPDLLKIVQLAFSRQ